MTLDSAPLPRSEEHADPGRRPPTADDRRALRGAAILRARAEAKWRALVGQRIGSRVVIAYVGRDRIGHMLRLRCDCGDESVVRGPDAIGSTRCRACAQRGGNAPKVERRVSVSRHTRYADDPAAQRFVAAHPDGAQLEEIGDAMGLSRERVRQIEEVALRRFAARMRFAGIGADDVAAVLAIKARKAAAR